ncbi:L,D-transpeptidase-like protein [Mumia flava]|uniref:L,D-transpeptidase-like protein n=1 Tax=Mumia flava TaxID=1348852 RepID=A0A2M9BDM3_9ACTN|nr:L,D-transpeptidase family protein [Mumia flava]PJJ56038.1 L,D-transpeptidase-like protein [Mumia flava]
MIRSCALASALVVAASVVVVAPPASAASAAEVVSSAPATVASAAPAGPAVSASGADSARAAAEVARRKNLRRFARTITRPGQRDASPTSIKHVRELQYRLRWAGAYGGRVSGYYGKSTKKAVKRFQKRVGLRRTGKANPRTWAKLIPKTTRARKKIPKACKRKGWVACYDRKRHQVTLWRSGRMWNAWLVRGGSASTPTRTGRFSVFLRSRHHVSSLFESKMPYAQFFSGGQAFHASYLMMDPFDGHSHGCVNMSIPDARQLWNLTASDPMRVVVYGAWD